MSAEAAFLVADILSDNAGRSVTFGLDSPLATRFWTAVKTGTSKDMRDNWCIGFSRRYTVGVWVGNFEGDAMKDVSGISGAAPAWAAIMAKLHAEQPGSPPQPPEGVVQQAIRFDPAIEPAREEWFIAGTQSEVIRAGQSENHQAHLESPPDSVIIALDPDIPPANQQVWFKAHGGDQAVFTLDGTRIGPARIAQSWRPQPGQHVLQLQRESDGLILDTVRFQVRTPR
jgi:penicillin-binding protein 1C